MNIEKAKELLKYSTHRNTPERYIVLDVVFQLKKFTKIELVDKVRTLKNRVSAATVYNSLEIFESLGIIEHIRDVTYSVIPDQSVKIELNGLVSTIKVDIAEAIEWGVDSKSKIELIRKLHECLPFEESTNFFKTLLDEYKECEQEFDNREEVIKAFDVVINSIK